MVTALNPVKIRVSGTILAPKPTWKLVDGEAARVTTIQIEVHDMALGQEAELAGQAAQRHTGDVEITLHQLPMFRTVDPDTGEVIQ